VQAEVSSLADPAVVRGLTGRGYRLRGFENVLGRSLAAGPPAALPEEGVAHLCGAATLPAHRRRGVQSALLAARLEIAAGAGCDTAVVITQPGSKSQENVQRQGFHLLYARAILVRES
jgi:ribosomal protein S18 acetylase RimI-like enzyme